MTDSVSTFAAIDLGASSGRVMLGTVSAAGLEIAELHRFPNDPVRTDGELRFDIRRLFDESLVGIRLAVAESARLGVTLSGIGIDSWGVDYALLGETDDELIVTHHRGAADPRPLIASRPLSAAAVYRASGIPDQAINTSFRIAATPGVAGDLLFVPDLWVYLLTGERGTEATIASTSQLRDAVTGQWSPALIEAYGVGSVALPTIVEPGTHAGSTTSAVTELVGASEPIPVFRIGSHDTASAFAFVGDRSGGEGLVSSGTWSLVGSAVPEPITTDAALAGGFTNERGVRGTLFLRNLNGLWVLQECLREWRLDDGEPVDLATLLSHAAAASGTAYALDLGDERLLPPGGMPDRIVELCTERGSVPPTTRAETVRVILDSLALTYAESLAAASALTGDPITSVRLVGGGSNNALLAQLTADATGLPVTAGPAEASSIGNIALQAVTAGVFDDLADAYRSLSGPGASTTFYSPGSTHTHPSTAKEDS